MSLQQLLEEEDSKKTVVVVVAAASVSRIDSVLQQLYPHPRWCQHHRNRMDEVAADRNGGRFLHHHTVEEDSSSWWMAVDGHFFLALALLMLGTIAFKGRMTWSFSSVFNR